MSRGRDGLGPKCPVTFQLIWIKVEQGPIVLAVSAGGGSLDILFSLLS